MLWEHKLMSQLCQVLETFKPISVHICIVPFSKKDHGLFIIGLNDNLSAPGVS